MKPYGAPLLLFALSLAAQGPARNPSPATAPSTEVPKKLESTTAEAPEPPDTTVLAHLGKRTIVYGDFSKWFKLMGGPRASAIRQSKGSRDQAIKRYLELQVLEARARRMNIKQTREFKYMLAVQEQQCLAKVLLDEERKGGDGWKLKERSNSPSDDEVRAYFLANKSRFVVPAQFTVRHLLVSRGGSMMPGEKGRTEAEAKELVTKIQDELKAGKNFEDLAKEYSDDIGSRADGGLCRDVTYGRFVKEFEDVVRVQDIGKVSDPVETPYGYHLIQVLSRNPMQAPEFEQVKDAVKERMIPERRERLMKEYLEAAMKEAGFRLASEGELAAKPAAGRAREAKAKAAK